MKKRQNTGSFNGSRRPISSSVGAVFHQALTELRSGFSGFSILEIAAKNAI